MSYRVCLLRLWAGGLHLGCSARSGSGRLSFQGGPSPRHLRSGAAASAAPERSERGAPRPHAASPAPAAPSPALPGAAGPAPDPTPAHTPTPVAAAAAAPTRKRRRRLDEVCCELVPQYSRNVVQSWIAQGKVLVNEVKVTKAGAQVSEGASVRILAEVPRYVCRAGLKLEAALDAWGIDPAGLTCLDAGLSTGGFTDCLLQRGAARVYGVDVGYGQVAERVRTDPRVVVMERTNLRHLSPDALGGARVQLATLDLSFISVLKVLPAVLSVMAPNAQLVVLVKPQFEAGKAHVSAGGVVRDPAVHREVVARMAAGASELGLRCVGSMQSPIKGAASGNTEFLAYFMREAREPPDVGPQM